MQKTLFTTTIQIPREERSKIDVLIENIEPSPILWEPANRKKLSITQYFTTKTLVKKYNTALSKLLRNANVVHSTPLVSTIKNEDWALSWRRFFRVTRAGKKIVIVPSWETFSPKKADVPIYLDPGMSFGTGLHPTTKMCIRMIEELAESGAKGSFLDIGCGSGILSIAAAKLGFSPVHGIDNDPLAVSASCSNTKHNHVRCRFSRTDVLKLSRKNRFNIVTANMLAQELERNAPAIVSAVHRSKNSKLILAGMLSSQFDETMALFQKLGFGPTSTLTLKGWKSAFLVRTK